ncbi:ribonuclease P protein subunit Rpp21 [Haematobia irritans]|uniref:ribonuclease P protein subunit Rpp21 n=1 Tax=Haematobia irritans TaxID=7368 RepID=UPI003F504B5D
MSQTKNKIKFQGKECFNRMNFLYQASILMAGKNNTLASYYGELCKNVGKKAVLRMEPNAKRVLCKRCSIAQKPGITCEITAKTRKNSKALPTSNIDERSELMSQCTFCGNNKKFIINSNYEFWLENKDSVAEVLSAET